MEDEHFEMVPRGRPPINHRWVAGIGYVHVDTGELFDRGAQKYVIRVRKTASERKRYWDPAKQVRERRLLRYATRE